MNLYDQLGVDRDATPEEILAAGRRAQKAAHPDLGGDAEAFRSVTRALAVLRDPRARERYDKTGEASEEAELSDEARQNAEAMSLIPSQFSGVVANPRLDFERVDIVGMMTSAIQAGMANLRQQIEQCRETIERIQKMEKRLKGKGAAVTHMRGMLRAQMRDQEMKIESGNHQLAVAKIAMEMLKDASWGWMKRPAPTRSITLAAASDF